MLNTMNFPPEVFNQDVGAYFMVETVDGWVKMRCIEQTADTRVLECDEGTIELDWMEWIDQVMLGRICPMQDHEDRG